jgi:predicted amidohydrolase YtcJ
MKTMRNRIFVLLVSLSVIACSEDPAPTEPAARQASGLRPNAGNIRVIHNAVIHTVNQGLPQAAAMAFTTNGQIIRLGSSEALLQAYPGAELIDLGGRTVIPGLIDSHGHLAGLALSLSRAQLAGTSNKEEVISRLKAHELTLGPDDWLLGRGWDQNDWPVKEFPTRRDLDEHFPDRAVWLIRIDGHAGWANGKALGAADRDLSGDWQEEGGYIHRDAAGQPTGILVDGAQALVQSAAPPASLEVLDEGLGLAIDQMLSLGLTGVHDPGISRAVLSLYQARIERDAFDTRVYAMTNGAGETLDWLCENGAVEHPSGRLLMRSTKLYMDGALGSRGAALLEDYTDEPGNQGLLFMSVEDLTAQVNRVLECGFQAAIHAIGDRGNRAVLDALEIGMENHPDNPGRHRVEHAQLLTDPDLGRFAQLDVIAAMQPTHATSDMYWAEHRVGPDRIRFGYAWQSLLDSGARLAFGSDFPVEAVNPMLGLHAAVTRQDAEDWPEGGWYPDERVSREMALRGFTLDAAFAGFMEDRVGSLETGKRADFVVIDRDLMTVPAEEIHRLKVLETWLDGERVYPR